MLDSSLKRQKTHQVQVGGVGVGGDSCVSVQSMCNTKTEDVKATLDQITELALAGCEIVRVAIPRESALDSFEEICRKSCLPVVADIHFDHRLAIEACRRGASGIRINPGNIGSWDKVDAVIEEAKKTSTPIRIGVNAGSLAKAIDARDDLSLVDKLVLSSVQFVEHFRARGFEDIVLSAKAHDVNTTIATYRRLSQELPDVALHLGVTEAGTFMQGTIKSAIGLGVLLEEGIGNTFRVSLTDDPVKEVRVAWEILQALNMRRRGAELVSCPTCGRTQVDLIGIASEVEQRLVNLKKPITVACMGCVVNGPGEAKGADIGVACGVGQGLIFAKGEVIRKVSEDEIVDALFEEIENRF